MNILLCCLIDCCSIGYRSMHVLLYFYCRSGSSFQGWDCNSLFRIIHQGVEKEFYFCLGIFFFFPFFNAWCDDTTSRRFLHALTHWVCHKLAPLLSWANSMTISYCNMGYSDIWSFKAHLARKVTESFVCFLLLEHPSNLWVRYSYVKQK